LHQVRRASIGVSIRIRTSRRGSHPHAQTGLRKAIACNVALAIFVEVSIMTVRDEARCYLEEWRFTIRSIE
jgi:hypothetical protein